MIQPLTDAELIKRYQEQRDPEAARQILLRYYNFILGRLSAKLPVEDAEDCAQRFWERFFASTIFKYRDSGCFERYLLRSVTLGSKEHWRNQGIRERVIKLASDVVGKTADNNDDPMLSLQNQAMVQQQPQSQESAEHELMADQLIDHLVNHLVPSLVVDQRIIWLLKHEAEFHRPEIPLQLATLAQLNAISEKEAWCRFELVHNSLIMHHQGSTTEPIDPESFLIYVVWCHSQRPDRSDNYTMTYFSSLLNVPENTLKTRYRTAQITIDRGLNDFLDQEGS